MSIEIKNWDEQIEQLINKSIIGYRVLDIDLSTERLNEPFEIKGNFLQVLDIPNNPPDIEIIFNDIFEYPIKIKEKEQFIYPFRRFYISNKQGQGKLKLFIGKNFELTPYSKAVVNFGDVINKLNEVLNALQNLTINAQTINLNTDELEAKLTDIKNFLTTIYSGWSTPIHNSSGYLSNINNYLDRLDDLLYNKIWNTLTAHDLLLGSISNNTFNATSGYYTAKTKLLAPNEIFLLKELDLNGEGKDFDIKNHSYTNVIFLRIWQTDTYYDECEIEPQEVFSTNGKRVINKVDIFNFNPTQTKISYFIRTANL